MSEDIKRAIENYGVKARVITPDDGGHYFFAYYDLQPFDSTGRYHLVHKVAFEDRLPQADDVCEIGMLDLEDGGKFIKLAETLAWNFQQGALLRWWRDDDHILFNVFEDGKYGCCILNIKTGERRVLPNPIADVSPDGKWGLSINFMRVWNFRPGYGYCQVKDPWFDVKAPEDDGLFLMDMETGETKMLSSYKQIKEQFYFEPNSNGKLVINHINFNTTGDRYVMLFRNFAEPGMWWRTELISGDLEGNLYQLTDFRLNSHYHWKNDKELLIWGGKPNDADLLIFTDLTDKVYRLPEREMSDVLDDPNKDIHCLWSPNRKYILGDGYPDTDHYRNLHFIDPEKNTDTIIGRYLTTTWEGPTMEFRCDLHARFDRTGRYISFDSTHTGKRTVCLIDMSELEGYEY
ncbi:MAG: hypothetical protein J6B93_01035 [Clostridia bacterium]|nr:hypothetical protein [Clostridia bacterium]